MYAGRRGLQRLVAMMRSVHVVRGKTAGTQEFLLGWLYGLVEVGALCEGDLFDAQQAIGSGVYMQASNEAVELYDYPSETSRRVEGLSFADLENEIIAGGPYEDSRLQRTYRLAADSSHNLHFVAKHYVFLSRARNASLKSFD